MNRNVQWNFVHTVNCIRSKTSLSFRERNQLGVKHVTQIPEKERKRLRIGTVGMVVTNFHSVAVLWIRIPEKNHSRSRSEQIRSQEYEVKLL
jgi:hypothetical protein